MALLVELLECVCFLVIPDQSRLKPFCIFWLHCCCSLPSVPYLGLFWEETSLCKGKRLPVLQIVNRRVQRELKRTRAPGHRMLWNVTVAWAESCGAADAGG